ncbi:uncharacterized protein LOC133930219 [Phragmites australis]|uniref:uncharacterized protein LOC133930219 n=1 Tax=Phragmites australis TaxID=29695 RepID=UPI002D792B6B|nr:uncharacterized protein LOC133930219 [Phragmites australis]
MHSVLNRIDDLRRAGLTSLMVVADYLRRRLAPLRERARFAWMYTGSGNLTRTYISPNVDLDEGALAALLNVVTGVDDLALAVLPREELALYADPGRAALQASLMEFDAQGMVDHPGRRNPGTIHIHGVDDNRGRSAAAKGSRPTARGDKGKRHLAYVPQLSSSLSPSPPRQRPTAGNATEGGRGGQSSGEDSGTEAGYRARQPEGQSLAGGTTAGGRTDQPSEAGSGAGPGAAARAEPQRPEGQSPPPKRRKAEPGPKPQSPDFWIPESRWRYHRPKTTPPKDSAGGQNQPEQPRPAPVPGPSAPADPEPRAPASSEPRALAGPEQRAPTAPAPSPPRKEQTAAGEVVATRAVSTRSLSGSPSAFAERARRGPIPQPPSGQAPEPLPEVLGSAREVIGRLEVVVVVERFELDKERATLVDERGRLEEARKLLETRIVSARVTHKKSMLEVAKEREALEETRNEVVSREEAASRREEAVRSAQADLARQNDELEHGHADVFRREEQVALHETNVEITALALDAREEQIVRREADAASASSTLTAREELVAKWEADLAAREQAVKTRAEQLERAQTEAAAQRREIPTARGVPTSAADGASLEDRLKNAEGELETVLAERTNVKLMMQDILQQA